MKRLLLKELRLAASPLSFIFIGFSLTTLIPGYPILVGSFFVCLGIFYSFQFSREYNDILFTALLPVRKRDVVRAKFAFVVGIQGVSFGVNLLMTLIRRVFFGDSAVYASNPLMNANLTYLGFVLLLFAIFNRIFLCGFFKTGYYYGKPFVAFCVAAFALIALAETLHHLPGLGFLNGGDSANWVMQSPFFAAAALIYGVGTALSLKKAARQFERVDLL